VRLARESGPIAAGARPHSDGHIPMTIAAAVFDAVAAIPGRGCLMREVAEALPDIDRAVVRSAVHRLSEMGVLVARHNCFGFMYSIAPGATRPIGWSRQVTQARTVDALL
jgi:hypothetical protein